MQHPAKVGGMDWFQPRKIEEALRTLGANAPRVLAGGTDVFPALQNRPLAGPVMDVSRIESFRRIEQSADGVVMGGGVTWTDVLRADLPPCFAALRQAAAEVGSVQIQNRGTIAGNICNASPAADGVPPLLVLEAEVELASLRGTRRMPLEHFILGNRKTALAAGELLTAIHVPRTGMAGHSRFLKLGARRYLVISIAMVAARIVLDQAGRIADCAIAVGACSPVARRMRRLEQSLIGTHPSGIRIGAEALDGLSPIDDVRAPREYRWEAVAELILRAIAGATA
jgi:CO/xanthine dehydrogenase FAD-binding subunit